MPLKETPYWDDGEGPARSAEAPESRPWFLPAVGAWYKLLDWIQ